MRVIKIKINNYRNLDDIDIFLDDKSNYIVGENNLGKSNFLSALDTVFSAKRFNEEDYGDITRNIEVIIKLSLKDEELGFFGDNFDPEDSTNITLKYSQSPDEVYPILICENTEELIPIKELKKVHFTLYQSTVSPDKELKLTTRRGAGNVFGNIVESYISTEKENNNFLDLENVEKLTDYINARLGKLKGFAQYGIKAKVANDNAELLSNMFYLSDGDRRIEKTGCGVQFIAMATLNILGQIMDLYKSKTSKFSEQVYTNKDGEKILPLIIALDEPEVHLHPYLQRTLINYYKSILSNEETEFLSLLKAMFDVDGLDGQLIVVTHSSDILLDDYKNIIRFYASDNKTNAISGNACENMFDKSIKRQLYMRFKDIRETFFAHAVVIVEGETEYGCLPYFAESLGINLDEKCISIVMAKGETSIASLKKLFACFRIPSVSIYDGDVKDKRNNEGGEVFFTRGLCLETDVVDSVYSDGNVEVLKQIAMDVDWHAENTILDSSYTKYFKKIGKDINDYPSKKIVDVDLNNRDEVSTFYKVWLLAHKGVITGRIIGQETPIQCIPTCYRQALIKAVELAK